MRIRGLCLVLAVMLCLAGCGGGSDGDGGKEAPPGQPGGQQTEQNREENTENPAGETEGKQDPSEQEGETEEESFTPYQAPEFADAVFHAEAAQGDGNVQIDLSSVAQGYVAVAVQSEARLKFQVIKGEVTYTYDIASDGTPSVFPIQSGDGLYTFRVMENIVESKYSVKYTMDSEVALADEFQPYIRPSDYVNYSADSACVQKAAELAKTAPDALGVVRAIYDYICASVIYDREKAETVQSGYLPRPDETMQTGKGICFDYASLAAAMLRSQGIPTKVIFGYVSPDDVYHAWNMFYTRQTGWVTVDYEVDQNSWNRLDLTFSANGEDSTFIGDGGNYADVYMY